MILSAIDVVDLQFFLMDGVRRYVVATGDANAVADDLLASAAALDYALLLSSERANEPLDDAMPIARSIRETMARAALAALDLIATIVAGPRDPFAEFARRHVGIDGIFATIASLRARGAIVDDRVAFRALTLADESIARRNRDGR